METEIPELPAKPKHSFQDHRVYSCLVASLTIVVLVLGLSLSAQAASYTVQAGDTLWLIGQRFGVTVNQIKEASGIWQDQLFPGDILTIPEAANTSALTSRGSIRPSKQEVELLAQMIMAEAEGESYQGKVAVGAVIVNRLNNSAFPTSLTGVLYETHAFEPVMDGSLYSKPATQDCIDAAIEALSGVDPTSGALYFYNPRTARSAWIFSRPVSTQIGNHVFAK